MVERGLKDPLHGAFNKLEVSRQFFSGDSSKSCSLVQHRQWPMPSLFHQGGDQRSAGPSCSSCSIPLNEVELANTEQYEGRCGNCQRLHEEKSYCPECKKVNPQIFCPQCTSNIRLRDQARKAPQAVISFTTSNHVIKLKKATCVACQCAADLSAVTVNRKQRHAAAAIAALQCCRFGATLFCLSFNS